MKIKRVTDTFIERKEMVFIAIVETLLIKLLWNFALHMIESTVYVTYWKTKGILQQTLSVPIGILLFLLYILWWVWKQDPEYRTKHAKQYKRWRSLIGAVRMVPAAAIVVALTLIWQEWSLSYVIAATGVTFVLLAILALVLTGISRLFLALGNLFGKRKEKRSTADRGYRFWFIGLEIALCIVWILVGICGLHRETYDTYLPERQEIHAMIISYDEGLKWGMKKQEYLLEGKFNLRDADPMSKDLKEQMLDVVEVAMDHQEEKSLRGLDATVYVTYCLEDGEIVTRCYVLDNDFDEEDYAEELESFWYESEYQEILESHAKTLF